MEFSYGIDRVKDCINITEQQLRNVISIILSRKYGSDWEYSSPIWNDEMRKKLETTQRQDQGRRPYQIVSQRLIDYTDLVDLQDIIDHNWNLFDNIFRSKKTLASRFDDLLTLRNPEMHGRPDILVHQKHLCLGVCGEILQAIDHWRSGYEHAIKEYAVQLRFPVYEENKDQINVIEEAKLCSQKWLKDVCGKIGLILHTLLADENTEVYRAVFQHTHAKIDVTWNYRGNDGRFFDAADVLISTSNLSTLHQILKAGEYPYQVLIWTLRDDLDPSIVAARILEHSGKKPISSSAVRAGDTIILNHAEFRIDSSNEHPIRITLSRWQPNEDARLCLIYDGSVNTGFYEAHNVFSAKDILSILYGETPFWKIKQMINQACSLTTQE